MIDRETAIALAKEATQEVVDHDFAGNPITTADALLMGAYGPLVVRMMNLAVEHSCKDAEPIGEFVAVDDGLGTVFIELYDQKSRVAGVKIYTHPPEAGAGGLGQHHWHNANDQLRTCIEKAAAEAREQMREECVKLIDTIDDMEQSAYRHCQEAIKGLP